MRIDAQSPHEWREINQAIQNQLNCESKVFAFRGLHQALFETCLGLHLRFSHKRKMVAQLGLGDHLKNTEVELAKLGVRLKDSFDSDMAADEKSVLCYLHDLDDSLTGELYDHIETLKELTKTKIYRIHIAHHLFHVKKTFINKLSDYDIIVCSLNENYALVFTGDKVVLPVLTVGQLAWNKQKDLKVLQDLISVDSPMLNQQVIDFEANLPEGVKPWFPPTGAKRLFDRSVVILEGHDGSALLELLSEELGLPSTVPGSNTMLESASFCRWGNNSWFDQAEAFGRTPDELRGTLIIDAKLLDSGFEDTFKKSLETLVQLSK